MHALGAALLLAFLPGAAGAEIYRCVGDDGRVRFADTPCAEGDAQPHQPRGLLQGPGPAAPDPPRPAAAASAESVLLEDADLGPGWSAVREAPEILDADLRGWGVRDKRARHYARDQGGRVQVCSVEVWLFEDSERARAAHAGFAYPQWRILREGRHLVMLRGLTTARGSPPQRGLFPDCEALGERIRRRAGGG